MKATLYVWFDGKLHFLVYFLEKDDEQRTIEITKNQYDSLKSFGILDQ